MDAGIRYFDMAPFYGAGLSELRLGRFLADKNREEFVVSTKVGRLLHALPPGQGSQHGFVGAPPTDIRFDYSGDGIRRFVEASLRRSGLDRFDMLFAHDIGQYAHGPIEDARHRADLISTGIPAIQAMKADGTISAWRLGVNEVEVCLDLLGLHQMDIILLAGRYTLLDRRAEAKLLPLMRQCGTKLVIGGIFNSGILVTGPTKGATYDYAEASLDIIAHVTAINQICTELHQDRVAAALQFPLAEPLVNWILLGSSDPASSDRNIAGLGQPVAKLLHCNISIAWHHGSWIPALQY